VTDTFFRFPHTPHLAWGGSVSPRGDKVLSDAEVDDLLSGQVVVEEKLDGANLGLSAVRGRIRAQNRGDYLREPYGGQFSRLAEWLAWREDSLVNALGDNLIAFGEWCAARHSIEYDRLPDWWLLFDVYDRSVGKFWSTIRRDRFARDLDLRVVPEIHRGSVSLLELVSDLEAASRFGSRCMEGLVVRREDEQWLLGRAKLVHSDFSQTIDEHWRSRPIQWNRVLAQ
jgi:ATP-dependent RNA circularization protein (DNA/RNA ligase family)